MSDESGIWSVVLAAGDGTRLSRLTTTDKGETIPKQFCSLNRRECLLQLALRRAASVSQPDQVCTIVAAQHRRWWKETLKECRPGSIIVQPQNRGTAVGVALSLLRVAKHDPDATVVLLPADHYVADEATLSRYLARLADAATDNPGSVHLLGAEPDTPDNELGYIVPRGSVGAIRPLAEFVEKPGLAQAKRLIDAGGLWNMLIASGSVRGLLDIMESSYNFVAPMRNALNDAAHVGALSRLYSDLPTVDFSRDVLAHCPSKLKVIQVPHCGWTDLGTPKRVAATVRTAYGRLQTAGRPAMFLDLAKAYGRIMSEREYRRHS